MHILLVYDVDKSRVKKVFQVCKKYMIQVQESVFEVKISESKFKEMIAKLKTIIKDGDSVICYYLDKLPFGTKEIYGTTVKDENILL